MSRADRYHSELCYAIEVFVDVITMLADGKDDDELVFIEHALKLLAESVGNDPDHYTQEPIEAGTIRKRARTAKEALSRGVIPTPGWLLRPEGDDE